MTKQGTYHKFFAMTVKYEASIKFLFAVWFLESWWLGGQCSQATTAGHKHIILANLHGHWQNISRYDFMQCNKQNKGWLINW